MSPPTSLAIAEQLAPEHYRRAGEMDAAAQALVEELAFRYGRGYDSYLVVELNRQYFFSRGRQGLISFVRQRRFLFVIGGLIAPPDHWPALLAEFLDFCKARKYRPAFFNVDREQADLMRSAGFEVTKVGQDAIVDLATCTWKGKEYEWVRRQTNFCQRQGLVVSEVILDRLAADERARILAETEEISRDFLRRKPHGGQMRYFVGRYDPHLLSRRRLFVARDAHGLGRIEGFLLCNPAYDGQCWAFEMFRQRQDAVRGTTPFLMHQTILALAKEKVARASLCMIPALHCQEPLEGDSKLLRWFMRMSGFLAPVYDLQGMYHFKSRFRPRFESCYLAAYPKATFWMLRASLMVWGADRVNPFRLAARIMKQFFQRKRRATLAQPE